VVTRVILGKVPLPQPLKAAPHLPYKMNYRESSFLREAARVLHPFWLAFGFLEAKALPGS